MPGDIGEGPVMARATVAKLSSLCAPGLVPVTKTAFPSGLTASPLVSSLPFAGPL